MSPRKITLIIAGIASLLPGSLAEAEQPSDGHLMTHRTRRFGAVHPASEAMAQQLENSRAHTNLKAAQNYARIIRLQRYDVQREIDALEDEQAIIDRVVIGGPSSFHQYRRFYQISQKHAFGSEVYTALNANVTRPPTSDFTPCSVVFKILDEHGSLERMPFVFGTSPECVEIEKEFRCCWQEVSKQMETQSHVGYQAVAEFKAVGGEFLEAMKKTLRDTPHGTVAYDGRKYRDSVKTLISRVHYQPTQDEIIAVTKHRSLDFKGRTARDLMFHLFANRIVPKAGSLAQQELLQVGAEVKKSIERQIASNKAELEKLKSQHLLLINTYLGGSSGGFTDTIDLLASGGEL